MRFLLLTGCLLLAASLGSAQQAVDVENATITYALATEPPNLNSMQSTDQVSLFVLSHVMDGLFQYDASGQLVPALAERWELREDGATFWLRRDAQWSDGEPVTAQDFVFAWQRAVLPETASQYAFILFPIKNAAAVNRGELPVSALGVRAVNDFQLEVSFERPCPYFPSLTAFMTYYPVREDFFRAQGERYAADAENLLFNGPFTLARWVHGSHLRLRKNPRYWNREAIALNEIDIPYITADSNAVYNLFKNASVAMANLSAETLDDALASGYPIHRFQTGSIFYLSFNFRDGRVSANRNLRKAIQALFNPSTLVNKVVALPGYTPAQSLFPRTVKGVDGLFRDEFPAPPVERGVQRARAYLERAKAELGVERIPPLVLLAGDSPRATQEAEYFQALLKNGLGIDLIIDNQIFKQRLEKMRSGAFDLVMAGWGPDYDDAMTYADLFSSWNENNRGQYADPAYDYWVRVAMNSGDQVVRMGAMAQLQRLIIEDVPILPTYESGLIYVQDPRLQNVVRARFGGDPNFRFATVEDTAP